MMQSTVKLELSEHLINPDIDNTSVGCNHSIIGMICTIKKGYF